MNKLMKKSLFILALLMLAAMTNALADDQIAVLQHEGETTAYYGGNAFVDAYNAAENGDLITLSAGNFQWCDISKCITIHGAGVRQDEMVNDRTQTVFVGGIHKIETYGSETEHLIVEGVYFSNWIFYWYMNHAEFFRCNFSNIYTNTNPNYFYNMANSKFINCRIGSMSLIRSNNVCLFNSIVFNVDYINQEQSTEKNVIAYNSFISYGDENPACSDFYNCVVVASAEHAPQSSCTIYNSVMVKNGYEGSLLEYAFNRDCLEVDELSQVFEDYTGDFDNELFILQDVITNSIQGTDGTEVGIYGGMYPFYDIPKYMIMRRCTVGSRTTDDGHLSVDIEVVTEQ